MKKLTVFYVGWDERWPLATLADNCKAILFEYTAEAMQQQLALSPRMLKLRVAACGDASCPYINPTQAGQAPSETPTA
ncbi:MAG: hypothetical protein LW731_01215 [Oxalobacteraceae bacterium]|nr:hypothetical protein [Oxalobacteraceae bacterium]